jgi:hypothetical protein
VLVLRADRDRDERAQLEPSVRTPRERSQLRSAAGDDRQHDVVDRAAEARS